MEDSDYTAAVDVWACGCIMGQMFHKNSALFRGETKVKQLDAIIKVIGTPGEDDLGDVGIPRPRGQIFTRQSPLPLPFVSVCAWQKRADTVKRTAT